MTQIHRFYDAVAISVGDGSTCYMGPKEARKIARALINVACSIERECFTQSSGLTVNVDMGPQSDTLDNPRRRTQKRGTK